MPGVAVITRTSIATIAALLPALTVFGLARADADTPLSMYLGPEEILLTLDVNFGRDSSADEIVAAVANIEHDIRLSYPTINRIYIEARSIIETTRPPAQPDTA